jgi:queuine tRNA-ribosyltransferase subunit QTRTD1
MIFNLDTVSREAPLHLDDSAFELDERPLLPGCQCFACLNHSRSYIHHLVKTGELLAAVLLQIHNNCHYVRFFQQIRAELEKGTFLTWKAAFRT